jgi:O-antigen ligase
MCIRDRHWLLGVPVFILMAYLAVVDFRKVFYLLLFCLPFSIEYELPGGFGTDLPSEFLMIALMGVGFLYFARRGKTLDSSFLRHPITLLLLVHLAWLGISTINSVDFFISIKFILAKTWYVVTFYFLAAVILQEEKDLRTYLWVLFLPMSVMICIAIVRHAAYDFSFSDINFAVSPFYRNHVNYACIISILFPVVWFGRGWYARFSLRWWLLLLGALLFLIAIQLSYTRTAYVGIIAAAASYLMFRWRLTRWVAVLSIVAGVFFIFYLYQNNKYLDYAPDYEKAITQIRFNNLLAATATGEDVSTMERVYRWVAGARMIEQKPIFGFGPGNFYNHYKGFTVTMFRTYVSDNPEHSGIHSYFLMTTVEQGIPGLLIFVALIMMTLIKGEDIYHQTKDPHRRRLILLALQSYIVIICILMINDMVETDKVGPFFFMNMAMVVNFTRQSKKI